MGDNDCGDVIFIGSTPAVVAGAEKKDAGEPQADRHWHAYADATSTFISQKCGN